MVEPKTHGEINIKDRDNFDLFWPCSNASKLFLQPPPPSMFDPSEVCSSKNGTQRLERRVLKNCPVAVRGVLTCFFR